MPAQVRYVLTNSQQDTFRSDGPSFMAVDGRFEAGYIEGQISDAHSGMDSGCQERGALDSVHPWLPP